MRQDVLVGLKIEFFESHEEQEVAIRMSLDLCPDKYPCFYDLIQGYTDTLHQRQVRLVVL